MEKRKFAIGIVGTSGSGKSYLTSKMADFFADKVAMKTAIFNLDNYFIERDRQPIDANGHYNFDTPDSLDLKQYEIDFFNLLAGKSVSQKVYNYNNPMAENPIEKFIEIEPRDIIIAEGIFTFYNQAIRKRFDFRIFVESPDEICLKRRLQRDFEERGYPASDVLYKFANHLAPAFNKYVEPMREKSHYVFKNEEDNFEDEFRKLTSKLIKIINQ